MKKIIAILLCALCIFPLFACTEMLEGLGSDDSSSNLTESDLDGTYEMRILGGGYSLEFDGDGEYTLYNHWGYGSSVEIEAGTYSIKNGKITFESEDGSEETMSISKDGNNLILDGNKWKYKK